MRFKLALVYVALNIASGVCCTQMVSSDSLHQDHAKLNLCIDRARHDHSFAVFFDKDDEIIPFEIDMGWVERIREESPDATFFASTRGFIVCEVTGLGKYGPSSLSLGGRYWRSTLPHPPFFQPSIDTEEGGRIATNKCLAELPTHSDLPNFDHAGIGFAGSVGYLGLKGTLGPKHSPIAGVQVSSYDVLVTGGAAYFKTDTIDQIMLLYTCLYSPMLELKAVGWRKNMPGPQVWLKSAKEAAAQSLQENKSGRPH